MYICLQTQPPQVPVKWFGLSTALSQNRKNLETWFLQNSKSTWYTVRSDRVQVLFWTEKNWSKLVITGLNMIILPFSHICTVIPCLARDKGFETRSANQKRVFYRKIPVLCNTMLRNNDDVMITSSKNFKKDNNLLRFISPMSSNVKLVKNEVTRTKTSP